MGHICVDDQDFGQGNVVGGWLKTAEKGLKRLKKKGHQVLHPVKFGLKLALIHSKKSFFAAVFEGGEGRWDLFADRWRERRVIYFSLHDMELKMLSEYNHSYLFK